MTWFLKFGSPTSDICLYVILDGYLGFFPINIKDTHWYLAVVNAAKHEIQVLDSFGTLLGRRELEATVSIN